MKRLARLCLAFHALIAPLPTCCAALSLTADTLDDMLTDCARRGIFNGVCLLAEGDTVLYAKAFGVADIAGQKPLTPDTVFELASVTKPFTATAILCLAREGRLKLSDEVGHYIPDWPYPGITLRHLMTHTSGLPDIHAILGDWNGPAPANNADLIARIIERRPPVQFPAGMGWNYSNTGYAVLAIVIEKASGTSYADYLQTHIFTPTGMTHSGVGPQLPEGAAEGALLTRRGYERWWIDRNLAGIVGDGGVYSTAGDLHRFAQAWFSGKLTGELTADALTPLGADKGPILYNGVGQGLGWNVKYEGPVDAGPDAAFHTGNFGGFRVLFWRDLRRNRTLILLDNRNDGLDEISAAAQAILDNKPWQAPGRSIADAMLQEMKSRGIDGALSLYATLKAENAPGYRFGERELNTLGYILLYDNAVDEAIQVFELNTRECPASFNAFDSLAEAYVKKGDTAAAIRAYETALRLNPGYTQGVEALKALRARQESGAANQ